MPLIRIDEQGEQTFEDFYRLFLKESNKTWVNIGMAMLKLVQNLNDTFKDSIIWAMTSHEYLILQNENNSEARSWVVVNNLGDEKYYITYQKYDESLVLKHTEISLVANSLEDAKKLILNAMNETEAWRDSIELKNSL